MSTERVFLICAIVVLVILILSKSSATVEMISAGTPRITCPDGHSYDLENLGCVPSVPSEMRGRMGRIIAPRLHENMSSCAGREAKFANDNFRENNSFPQTVENLF